MGSSEKKDIIPVVIFHVGCPEHLPYSVQSAQRWNERVILLGDEANRNVAREWFDHERTIRHTRIFLRRYALRDIFCIMSL